ncbi:MAG TPA: Crp/Fnr family transcriptional regulator [Flavihumibacter sp.]|nr:Crp/Fnr family transcriptional regulator [Bacteroidota bacterium]HPZ89533.1 Crp/Fnr family transcriptional regulator [Flavihumibacter sp.]
MEDIFTAVYNHPLLTKADLQLIADIHQRVEMAKGVVLQQEGKVANEYFILASGLVRAFVYNYNGDEITTDFFTARDIVIVPTSLFQRTPSQENLQALTDCELWKVNFEDFQRLFHQLPGFVEWGRWWFTSQLFSVKQRSLDMIRETATSRYLKLIEQKPDIIRHAPLKQIASYLGVTDTSLSRIRKEISV